jgi:hypothetical protein
MMAYVPGLEVKDATIIKKIRTLPITGETLINLGDEVRHNEVVARCVLPGDAYIVDIAGVLDIPIQDVSVYSNKKEGDFVEEGEPIAMASVLFGLFKSYCYAPCTGKIEMISDITGKCTVREAQNNVEILAYIPGTVVDVAPNIGVTIETPAALIQGIFGIGGETHGNIHLISNSPKEILTADLIDEKDTGKVLVGGSSVTSKALKKAVEHGVKAVVVGSMKNEELIDFMGAPLGVVITGTEELGLTLILTEGFGDLQMSKKAFSILGRFEGYPTSLNGSTQIRAGVIRPEIIIPRTDISKDELSYRDAASNEGLQIGSSIRVINEPYFGALGKVTKLPVELQVLESGSKVRVLEAELEDGSKVIIPRANVERTEWETIE